MKVLALLVLVAVSTFLVSGQDTTDALSDSSSADAATEAPATTADAATEAPATTADAATEAPATTADAATEAPATTAAATTAAPTTKTSKTKFITKKPSPASCPELPVLFFGGMSMSCSLDSTEFNVI
ncbi:unnamed protein product [Nyctereutes procyonoides]|uniref:(raccoon dog) hypothetical protein n=1 Tax=Nyctereutes procyonoides TaxID=34880 RepID=A0A811YYY5_NYCPR|nr:unnamed protein product [Nyctereutes procyonoides]